MKLEMSIDEHWLNHPTKPVPDEVMHAIRDGRIKPTERDQFDPTDFTQGPSMYTVTEQLGGRVAPGGDPSAAELSALGLWMKGWGFGLRKAQTCHSETTFF